MLESRPDTLGTDPLGVLAGRLKRRWLAERRKADAERSLALYGKGFRRANADEDHPQAFYHAINCAFMELAFNKSITKARTFAKRALQHCSDSPAKDVWWHATVGEAHLYLGDAEAAMASYQAALANKPEPRKIASMYQQAVRAADLVGGDALRQRVSQTFRQ